MILFLIDQNVVFLLSTTINLYQMTKTSSKSALNSEPPTQSEIEHEDSEILEEGEISLTANSADEDFIKRDSRRKIEIYWEKKRLKEQFEDFDESEFGF